MYKPVFDILPPEPAPVPLLIDPDVVEVLTELADTTSHAVRRTITVSEIIRQLLDRCGHYYS